MTSPRPYSRIHLLSGTKGFVRKWPVRGIALEPNAHSFMSDEEMEARRLAEEAKGDQAWKPAGRKRNISTALQAYARMVTSSDRGAIRDVNI